jgi:hypothetical protein
MLEVIIARVVIWVLKPKAKTMAESPNFQIHTSGTLYRPVIELLGNEYNDTYSTHSTLSTARCSFGYGRYVVWQNQ